MNNITKFSRQTLIEAISLLEEWDLAKIERLILKFGLEDTISYKQMNRPQIANSIGHHLIQNGHDDQYLFDFIEHIAGELKEPKGDIPAFMGNQLFSDPGDKLKCSLLRDGYELEDGRLKARHPSAANFPYTENSLRESLDEKGFTHILSHLDNAIASHTAGDWKSVNREVNSFSVKLGEQLNITSNPLYDALLQYIEPNGVISEDECTFRFQIAVVMGSRFLNED
jgi:hypothetical protein